MNVLQEFETRCLPITNAIYERYIFNKRVQQPVETLDNYLTAIIKKLISVGMQGWKMSWSEIGL